MARRASHFCADCGDKPYKRSELRGWRKKLYCDYHYRYVALVRCFSCPGDHEGWKRSEIRRRRGTDYCEEHVPAERPKWPDCPKCGDDDFGTFGDWKGSEKTTIRCEQCGFEDLAINHFNALVIKAIASPVEGYDK